MAEQRKSRIVVLYGGKSGEHEVSLRSAASVVRHLDAKRFEIIPVAIDKKGNWLFQTIGPEFFKAKNIESLEIQSSAPRVALVGSELVFLEKEGKNLKFDLVFPVMHGPLYEDGALQGLLELEAIPFVGCGVLASAVAMDKDMAKRVAREAGLPVVPYFSLKLGQSIGDLVEKVAQTFGFPVFVKPSNLGSSVGIHKVKQKADLKTAIEDAFRYDTKILVEKGIAAREIELAVLESPDAKPNIVSAPGEIIPSHEFYSYEAKYLDPDGARLELPAKLEPAQIKRAQQIAEFAFHALCCEGMARVDLFLDKVTGEFYFNELNTIPGFTSISMYPKMLEYSGIPYAEILSRLVDLGLERGKRKNALRRDR